VSAVESAQHLFDLLAERRRTHPEVCVVTADMGPATRASRFEDEFPDDFYDVGIAEQDMVCFACGLTVAGLVPVVTTASVLLVGRPWEQVRNMADRGGYNVKLVATGCGLTNTRHSLGLTALEDLALLSGLRNFEVYSPFSAGDIAAVLARMLEREGPTYVRLGKYDVPSGVGASSGPFSPLLVEGDGRTALVTTGFLMAQARRVQQRLAADGRGIKVVNVIRVLPFPRDEMLAVLAGVDEVVVLEDHLPIGGLASHIALLLAEARLSLPFTRVGPERLDRCVGGLEENLAHHGMSETDVLARLDGGR